MLCEVGPGPDVPFASETDGCSRSGSDRCKDCGARCEYVWRFALLLEDDLSYCGTLLKLDKHHQRLVAIVSGSDAVRGFVLFWLRAHLEVAAQTIGWPCSN